MSLAFSFFACKTDRESYATGIAFCWSIRGLVLLECQNGNYRSTVSKLMTAVMHLCTEFSINSVHKTGELLGVQYHSAAV